MKHINFSFIITLFMSMVGISSTMMFTSCGGDDDVITPAPANGREYVDLGLSVKWATCNVGANNPWETGDYFAWGETVPKNEYSWESYKWCNGTKNTLTKYNRDSDRGIVDNKVVLDSEDDAAHVNWGGAWRMPTEEEFTELRTKCTWKWGMMNNINGYTIKGTNGNSIFLPASGFYDDHDPIYFSGLLEMGIVGDYWSSSLYSKGHSHEAYCIDASSEHLDYGDGMRCLGFSIRPVLP